MLTPFLLVAIALSVSLAEPLQKIETGIRDFSSKLFSILINPIFIITIIILYSIILIFLVISSYKSHIEYKKILIQEKKIVKKSTKSKAKKIHPKLTEVYIEPNGEEDEAEVEFDDEEPEKRVEPKKEEAKKQEEYKPLPIGTYSRSVNIRVDSDKRYFHKKNISGDEVDYLLRKNYQIKKYKNLLSSRMENFLLLPRFNESFTHLFLTKNISEFLEKNGIETELYITKKPDIVFKIEGKKYAIEIETGSIFSKIERMKEKLEVLKNYDEWFFVVTDRNKVKKYKKYGDAVDKRYVKQRLEKLIKMAKKAQK